MNDAHRATLAVSNWVDRLDRAEAELESGAAMPPDGPAAARMRQAIERARPVLGALARGEEAIRAEHAGARPAGLDKTLDQWARGEPSASGGARRARRARNAEFRDVAPTQALLAARQARDAVLRLGVWSVLGDVQAAARTRGEAVDLASLIAAQRTSAVAVPPGIAPTLAYAGSSDARDFFNGHLRQVLAHIGQQRGSEWSPATPPPLDGTAALAQRWSLAWSNAACAVYADWLARRGDGTLAGARASLWAYNGRDCPVRFRPAGGFAVIPTKGFRLHVDLWLQPVLAQVLAFDAARWRGDGVDGRWHTVRLAIHDLAARDVGDAADGSRTLFRGLSVEMLYQAIFIDRIGAALVPADLAAPASTQRPASPQGSTIEWFAQAPTGMQAVLAAVMERIDGEGGGGPLRRRAAPPPITFDDAQRRAIETWRESVAADAAEPVVALDSKRLDWHAALPEGSEPPGGALLPLGHAELWAALDDAACWLELVAVVRLRSGWVTLPLVVVDAAAGNGLRSWLALHADDLDSLAASGVDIGRLRARLGETRHAAWMSRRAGLGVFVAIGIDLRDGSG